MEGFGSLNTESGIGEERGRERGEGKETAAHPDVCQSQLRPKSNTPTLTLPHSGYILLVVLHAPPPTATGSKRRPSGPADLLSQNSFSVPYPGTIYRTAHVVLSDTHGSTLLFSKSQAATKHANHVHHTPLTPLILYEQSFL